MKNIFKAILIISVAPAVGLLSGLIIRNNVFIYNVFVKPPFSLPDNLFSVVWGALYLMMGIALYLFLRSDASGKQLNDGTALFAFQILLNFSWPVIFFNFRMFFTAFLVLIALFIFVAVTLSAFFDAKKLSGILLIPYLLFLVYAGYLNFGVWLLNM